MLATGRYHQAKFCDECSVTESLALNGCFGIDCESDCREWWGEEVECKGGGMYE